MCVHLNCLGSSCGIELWQSRESQLHLSFFKHCLLCPALACHILAPPQEYEERRRQEAELAKLRRDREEGEEVPLGTTAEGEDRKQGQGVELHLRGDVESEDSDDGPEVPESEGDLASFQTFLQQQKRES